MATPPLTAALFVELFEGVLLVPSRWQHLHTRSSWQQRANLISDNNNYLVHLTGHFGATSRRCLRRSMIRFLAAIFLFGHLNNLAFGAVSFEIGAVMKRRLIRGWMMAVSSRRMIG